MSASTEQLTMRGSPPRLPCELLQMIVRNYSPRRRNGLHPLLVVSRDMHDIALPFIYQTLLIIDPDEDERVINRGDEPSTRIPYTRTHLLKRTLETRPHFSAHIEAIIDSIDFSPHHHSINEIIPLLTHLQRLYLSLPIHTPLSKSVQLTHLSCTFQDEHDPSPLIPLLESQRRSLLFLSLPKLQATLGDVLPLSLPQLQAFDSCHTNKWDALADIAPQIQHLECSSLDLIYVRKRQLIFNNLVSLKIRRLYGADTVSVIGRHLKAIKWLYISSLMEPGEHLAIEDLMDIASPHLSYIRFVRNASGNSRPYTATDVQTLFNQYPSLRIVDIGYQTYMISTEAPMSRYRRDKSVQEKIPFYLNTTFEMWWEPLEAELDCF